MSGRMLLLLHVAAGALITPATRAPPARAVATPAAPPIVGTLVSDATNWYSKFSTEQYLAVACAQSCVLRSSSDLVGQTLRGVPELSFAHAAAMGTMGVLCSGLIGATWLRVLEGKLGSGTSGKDVMKKTAADFCVYAPFANSAYLLFVPLLTALFSGVTDVPVLTSSAIQTWDVGFTSAMQLELSIFAPYNLLSFRMIPAAVRPTTTAAACAVYTVALSALC